MLPESHFACTEPVSQKYLKTRAHCEGFFYPHPADCRFRSLLSSLLFGVIQLLVPHYSHEYQLTTSDQLWMLVTVSAAFPVVAEDSSYTPCYVNLCLDSQAVSSGPRYMICVTLFCTMHRSKNTLPSCAMHSFHMCLAYNSRMAVCFFTCSTCKNIFKNDLPIFFQVKYIMCQH